jgi:hypothetical protein
VALTRASWPRPVTLVAVLLGLWTSLIAASIVPDPTWIGGIYDGGDGDEIAIMAGDRLAAPPPAAVALIVVAARTPLTPSGAVPLRAAAVRSSESRAPPAA